MKKAIISIIALLTTIAAFWGHDYLAGPSIESTIGRVLTSTEAKVQAKDSRQLDQRSSEDLNHSIERVRGISKKALLSREDADELSQILSNRQLQDRIFEVLSGADSLPFDVDQEKERMEMIAILNLMAKQKGIEGRQTVVDRAVERILSVDFKTIREARQRQSIFGDTVEIIQILKNSDPDAYEAVKASIAQQQQKPMMHALYVAR